MAAEIFRAAKARLIEIWHYTDRTWGEAQASKYVHGLVAAIEHVEGKRHLWRAVPADSMKDVFFIRHEHHLIFFRELRSGNLGIISILHETMDIPARLKEDSGDGQNGSECSFSKNFIACFNGGAISKFG